jgi:hypothetical protein
MKAEPEPKPKSSKPRPRPKSKRKPLVTPVNKAILQPDNKLHMP